MRVMNKKVWIAALLACIIVVTIVLVYIKSIIQTPMVTNPLTSPSSTSPVQSTSTSSLKTYRNDEWGFEFEYPADWIIADDGSSAGSSKCTRMGAPADKKYLIYMPSPPIVINIVIPEFVEGAFSDVTDVMDITVDGVAGKRYTYKFQGVDNTDIVLPIGSYKLILGGEKPYESVFNQILSTFKFLK